MEMEKQVKVSIIMGIYNCEATLPKAIDSVLEQTYSNWELIMCDDASKDGTYEVAREYAERYPEKMKLLRNEENKKLSYSLNRCLEVATGEYVARMDADDISLPDRLACQLRFLRKKRLDLCGTMIIHIDADGNKFSNGPCYPTNNRTIRKYLKITSSICHPTWFAKQSVFKETPYYDYKAAQDYDLLLRLAAKGYRFGTLKAVKLKYRLNPRSISSQKHVLQKTAAYFVRSNYLSGNIRSIDDFRAFCESEAGKQKIEGLTKYYAASPKIKEYLHEKRLIRFLMAGCRTFLISPEGRNVVWGIVYEKLLILWYGKRY